VKPEHEKYILDHVNKKSIKGISHALNLKERKIRKFLDEQKNKKEQVHSPQETISTCNKKTIFLSILLIVTLGFVVYGNSLNGKFIWDDGALIENNQYIKNWSYLPQTFTQDIGAGFRDKEWNSYRPFQMVTYMMDYSVWKLNPIGYHLTNVLLHIFAALSLYWLINITFKENWLALLTGMFFVVHPIHTEAVTYISGRADPLALLFMLLCSIFYLKRPPSKGMGTYLLMMVSYALALFSRENSLILPVLVLLYHYSFKKKLKIKEFFSLVSIAFVYILLRITILKALLEGDINNTTLLQRLPGFFVAITNYIKLLFLPTNLHMEYGGDLVRWGNPQAILGAVLLFALVIFAFRKKENNRLTFFAFTWFFVALLPVSNLYPINAYMAEHWLYVPSIGFFLIVAKVISSLCRTKDFRIFAVMIAISSITFYSYLTIRQNRHWRDSISFYEHALKSSPSSPRLHSNLGGAYHAIDKNEKAIAAYKKAIEIKPDNAEAYYGLGVVYLATHRNEEAIIVYKKTIEIKNDYAKAYYNLGSAYHAVGKNEEAIAVYKKAIKIKPDYVNAYNNLGNIYRAVNKTDAAIAIYKKILKIDADYANAYYNLGGIYYSMNKSDEAIAAYKKVIEIKGDYAGAYNNLAIIYFHRKQYKLAIQYSDHSKMLGLTNSPLLEVLKPYR